MNSTARAGTQPVSLAPKGNRLFHFLTEMQRRRVCRAITMYSVAMWLVCQIVDVISPALELPDWTLKLVIVFGLIGLPIIIIMSWLFEITPDGLVPETSGDLPRIGCGSSRPKHISDRLIDGSLILAALAIGVQLAVGSLGGEAVATENPAQRIAVLSFRANTGEDTARFSEGLAIELQHALRQRPGITVIASSDSQQLKGSMRLTGAISTDETRIHVAVTMINVETSEVVWSAAFQRPRSESSTLSSELATQIATAIPISIDEAGPVGFSNVAD